MVTKRGLVKYMGEANQIAQEINEKPELVIKVLKRVEVRMENGRRQPKPPPPEGGISLRKAEKKFGVLHSTLSRWVQKGLLPVLSRTKNWLYVDEKRLEELLTKYKKDPGKGKRTAIK